MPQNGPKIRGSLPLGKTAVVQDKYLIVVVQHVEHAARGGSNGGTQVQE